MQKVVLEFTLMEATYEYLTDMCEELGITLSDFFRNYAIVCYKNANE